ncbi:PEP/pyruvate-binding domain-containing protein [Bordetella sp. BOR01]|uniref:PEP/pyruvate-binding domain-containing protein n=1 Tax=Bordetella sp. BOR01 TaxID=2854779 RepID=UPI001C46134E|nr:PEP/pyruvate-binding domain-containing protein [Bordetella sp. BOR01]MBV7483980.1 pyruvate, water dikinase [Bordetella sp. BOR01]
MSALLLDWPAAAQAGPAVAGGKGWQLGRMACLGVPVPAGFVIAAHAGGQRQAGDAVPAAVQAALADEIARRGWQGLPLALRSSASMEDSAGASFAGIYLSRLNVRGHAAMLQAVRDIWDSAFTTQAQAYRQGLGIAAGDQAGMAVVVMPLLAAESAGIVFTCDPVSGRDDHTVIHAHWGLGEALVGGQAEGDEYRLQENRVDGSLHLVDQRLGAKARYSVPAAAGGTELRALPGQRATQPVLTPAQAIELAGIAHDAAAALDYAHGGYDLEWAWDGERYWIVQARPITARAHHTYPALAGQPAYWSRGNVREILPDPLSPLDWTLCRAMADRMLTRGYELAGYRILPGAAHAALFHGRLYLQTSLMQWEGYDALGIPPRDMNRLLGGEQPAIAVPPPALRERGARGLRLLRYLRAAGRQRRAAPAVLAHAMQQAAAWRAQPPPATLADWGTRLRARFAAVRGADDLFFLQGSGGGTLFNLVQLIDKYCPGQGHALAAALMAGGPPSVTAAQGYALLELARIAAHDGPALAWLRQPGRPGTEWARALADDSPFRQAFDAFLQRYGHRGLYETYLRSPRWREAPDYLLDQIAGLVGHDEAALRERQRRASTQAWQRVRGALPIWLRPLARQLLKAAQADSNHREAARSALAAYLEALRNDARALAPHFGGPGGLQQPDDIFNLTAAELYALAEGRLAPAAAARRAAERRARLQDWSAHTEPAVIAEHGTLPAMAATAPGPAGARAGTWQGTPVSSGQAQGRIHIAHSPADGLGMAAGDVLAVPSTDPAWTPLFLKAGALIMETGGYLSHGAIVAREFGIPAVANVPGILRQLQPGEPVQVDGTVGRIQRL